MAGNRVQTGQHRHAGGTRPGAEIDAEQVPVASPVLFLSSSPSFHHGLIAQEIIGNLAEHAERPGGAIAAGGGDKRVLHRVAQIGAVACIGRFQQLIRPACLTGRGLIPVNHCRACLPRSGGPDRTAGIDRMDQQNGDIAPNKTLHPLPQKAAAQGGVQEPGRAAGPGAERHNRSGRGRAQTHHITGKRDTAFCWLAG